MERHNVLIVGGGNAGISLGARLLRDGAPDMAIVEGQEVHRYRPLLNYVGAGEASMASLERPMADRDADGLYLDPRRASSPSTPPARP